jgi:hypothetical protein
MMTSKPQVLSVKPESIPQELKSICRWVVWRLELHTKKNGEVVWKKVPHQANGRLAQVTNPKHWSTYEDAFDAYLMDGYEGIGIAFDGSDGIHGIDLDDCVEDGQLSMLAQNLLDKVDGYAETSPSGTGIKLFTKSNLAINGKKGNVEVYKESRYFTVTGHGLNGHNSLPLVTQDVGWFVEEHFGANKQLSLEAYKAPISDWDLERVEIELLPYVGDIEQYDQWLQLGMALHHQGSGAEEWMELWDQASRETGSYNRRELEAKWDSFSEQRNSGGGAITLASIIKHVGEVKKAEQQKTFDKYKQLILDETDLEKLKTSVIDSIKAELGLDHLSRNVLAGILKTKFKDLGFPISIGDAKGLIKPKIHEGVPEWLGDWVYVTSIDRFFNVTTKRRVSQQGFAAMFNRFTGDDSAAALALDLFRIPTPDKIIYLPMADDTFDLDGMPCVNEYNRNSAPDVPASFSPGDLEAIETVLNHLNMILVEENSVDIMVSWMAFNAQNPGVKIRWAPLIKGIEGDGKSVLGNLMMGVMGMVNVGIVSPSVLQTGFTKWASGRCVNVLEEIRMVGHNRHDVLNTIKPYITNDQVTIHPKGFDEYVAPNTVNYIAFTNHHDALPLEDTDRRWWVQFTPFNSQEDLVKVADSNYFSKLFNVIRDHAPGLRKWLLEYKLSPLFNPKGQAPASIAKNQMVSLNTSDDFAIVKDLLLEGGYGFNDQILSSRHLTTALSFVEDLEVPKSTALHKMLMKLGYSSLGHPVKWEGKACTVWLKGSNMKAFNGLEKSEINDQIRNLLEKTKNEDPLS